MDLDCAHDDYPVSPLEAIRFTTNRVIKQLAHPPQDGISEHKDWEPYCVIDEAQLEKELSENGAAYTTDVLPPSWVQDYHFCDELDPETTAQYVLVLDALNFCFWPAPGYEYGQLASSLKAHAHEMSADTLAAMTAATLHRWLQPPTAFCIVPDTVYDAKREVTIPLLASRVSALRQIGASLNKSFQGKAVNLILQANHSAAELVTLVTAHFPAFRDSTVFRGMQVFFYKRAQIFVGDLVGAFNGKHLGFFHDMDRVTCFADYRIPQLLREIGVLRYSPKIAAMVDAHQTIPSNSEPEIAIRACTVQAVEMIHKRLLRTAKPGSISPFQLDWLLWERGERLLSGLKPHHKTLTIFY